MGRRGEEDGECHNGGGITAIVIDVGIGNNGGGGCASLGKRRRRRSEQCEEAVWRYRHARQVDVAIRPPASNIVSTIAHTEDVRSLSSSSYFVVVFVFVAFVGGIVAGG